MAAPNTVYKDFKTRRRKAGTPDVDIDLFIAKFLQNTTPPSGDDWGDGYFNSDDTEEEKIAKIKDIFKIDGWVQVAKGTATTPDMGFIGYCFSRNSGNGLYHKTERFSGVRVPTTAQASAELLNDAGLNTKGNIDIYPLHANQDHAGGIGVIAWNNYFKARIKFSASYYATSQMRQIEVTALNGAGTTIGTKSILNTGGLTQRTIEYLEATIEREGVQSGVKYNIIASHLNEEGSLQKVFNNIIASTKRLAIPFGFIQYYGTTMPTSSGASTSSLTKFMFEDDISRLDAFMNTTPPFTAPNPPIVLYKDARMNLVSNNQIANGYYNMGYSNGAGQIKVVRIENGVVAGYELLNVTTTYKKYIPTVVVNTFGLSYMRVVTEDGNLGATPVQINAIKFFVGSTLIQTDTFQTITIAIGNTADILSVAPPDDANKAQFIPVAGQVGVLSEQFPICIIPSVNNPI